MREGWQRVALHEAADVSIGRQRAPKHADGQHMVPYLRAANVKDGSLVLEDVLKMNFEPIEQRKLALRSGDVLVTEGCGSIRELGASARWSDELPSVVCFQNTLLRLRARRRISTYLPCAAVTRSSGGRPPAEGTTSRGPMSRRRRACA